MEGVGEGCEDGLLLCWIEGDCDRPLGEELMLGPWEGEPEGSSLGLCEIEGMDEGDEDG